MTRAKRERRRPPQRSELLVGAGVAAQRVMGEIQLVALAHEHAERAVALAWRLRYGGHTAAQQLDRRRQLARVVALPERGGDVLGRDAERPQAPLDPLRPPGIEALTILGEP